MPPLDQVWNELEGSFSLGQDVSPVVLGIHLIAASALAWYFRWLYRRFSASPSDSDSISRVFPLLAVVTAAVIAVVKTSLALSLGLVGALSIVRFRAAIKDPEELVYLFLCIAIGLAAGAERLLLAAELTGVATLVVLGMHFFGRRQRQHRLLITITGNAEKYFADGENSVTAALDAIVGRYTLQRFDIDDGQGQVRVVLPETNSQRTSECMLKLRARLPDCDMSYVNLNSTI